MVSRLYNNMSVKKSVHKILSVIKINIEVIGLLLLLISFGWQCFEDNSNEAVYEAHILNINEKLDAIWAAAYDEVVHTDRFQTECLRNGNMPLFWFNYLDANVRTFKDWSSIKEELSVIETQRDFGWTCRVVLYILGSILIMIPKFRTA